MNKPRDETTPATLADGVRTDDAPLPRKSEISGTDESEKRRDPRLEVHRPLFMVPVRPDGYPDWEHRISGETVDVSRHGLGAECDRHDWHPSMGFVIGVRNPDGSMQYEGIDVRHTERSRKLDHLHLGGLFNGPAHAIVSPENLVPVFRPESLDYGIGQPPDVLRRWSELGVLKPFLADRVLLCPKCHGLPTFRTGCRRCGSARIVNDRLIHHFACAHVGEVGDFETSGGEIVCPKCRQRRLVVGADFEYQIGPFRCLDCHWSDTEQEWVVQCLRCGFRFAGQEAFQQELYGYHVNRLDPLALVSQS